MVIIQQSIPGQKNMVMEELQPSIMTKAAQRPRCHHGKDRTNLSSRSNSHTFFPLRFPSLRRRSPFSFLHAVSAPHILYPFTNNKSSFLPVIVSGLWSRKNQQIQYKMLMDFLSNHNAILQARCYRCCCCLGSQCFRDYQAQP